MSQRRAAVRSSRLPSRRDRSRTSARRRACGTDTNRVTSLSPIERRSCGGGRVEARDIRLQQCRSRSERPQLYWRIGRVPGTNRDVGAEILEQRDPSAVAECCPLPGCSAILRSPAPRWNRHAPITIGLPWRPHPIPQANRCRARDLPCTRRKARQHLQPARRPARCEWPAGRNALPSRPA